MTLRLPASTPRATRSARPTSRVQIEPDRPYSVSLASGPRRPRRRTAAPRPPGRRPPRARSASSGRLGGTTRRREPEARRRPARDPVNATSTLVDVGRHRVPLPAEISGPISLPSSAGSSDPERRDRRLQQRQELVVRRALAPGSGSGRSSPGRRCRRRRTARRRPPLEVGVGEDDVGALAAELERHPLHLVGAAGHDPLADLGGAGEADLADQRVGDEPLADDRALAGDHREHALRAARPRAPARRAGSRSAG